MGSDKEVSYLEQFLDHVVSEFVIAEAIGFVANWLINLDPQKLSAAI